jgi:hypothetical protein
MDEPKEPQVYFGYCRFCGFKGELDENWFTDCGPMVIEGKEAGRCARLECPQCEGGVQGVMLFYELPED